VPTSPDDRFRFFDTLVRAEIRLWGAVDAAVSEATGTNLGLITALRTIDELDGAARVQEVADEIGITVGAASKIVDRLERAGLAERVPNPADRRSSLLRMTKPGRKTLAEGVRAAGQELGRRTDTLTQARLDETTAALAALADTFSAED
jgi:DNA-binding MarR family transcriptional regulator